MLFASILSLVLIADEPKTAIQAVTDANDALRNYGGGHTGNNADFIASLRAAVLPVDLLSFKGQSMADFNLLTWTSLSEKNNSHYEIFKAAGNSDFQLLGSVSGAGDSNKVIDYSYKDYNVKLSETTYYKLRQVDFSGGFKDFSVVSLKAKAFENKISAIIDNNNSLVIYFAAEKEQNLILNLYGLNGGLIYADKLKASSGYSAYTFNIDKELVPGVYVVALKGAGDTFTSKVIK